MGLAEIHRIGRGPRVGGNQIDCTNVCCAVPFVSLHVSPLSVLAHTGGGKHRANHQMMFIVDDQEEAESLIRTAKDALGPQPVNAMAGVFAGAGMQGFAAMFGGAAPVFPAAEQTVATPVVVQATPVIQPVQVQPVQEGMQRGDMVSDLQKLSELKQAGALSESEFEAAKARLLGLAPEKLG